MQNTPALVANPKANCSYTGKGFFHGLDFIKKEARWEIGNGSSVYFWKDPWVEGSSHASLANCSIPPDDLALKFRDFLKPDGSWNCKLFTRKLSAAIVMKIVSIPVLSNHSEPDSLTWECSTSGDFSVSSVYHLLRS